MDTTPVAWDGEGSGYGLNFNFKYINVNPFNSLKKLTKVQKILNPGFFLQLSWGYSTQVLKHDRLTDFHNPNLQFEVEVFKY